MSDTRLRGILYNRDNLYDLYVVQELSMADVAKVLGCSLSGVNKALERFNILRRNRAESRRISINSGRVEIKPRLGADSPGWKGGRFKTSRGYIVIYCPEHPNAWGKGYVLEHRLVMEEKLGRYLLPEEKVHHINGVKDDNRPENLLLVSRKSQPMYDELCSHCPIRTEVAELQKQVKLLKWQVSHINKLLYGTEKPSARDILRRGLEE